MRARTSGSTVEASGVFRIGYARKRRVRRGKTATRKRRSQQESAAYEDLFDYGRV
ncbi:hypothetical protein VDBG_00901 [Verticillium alfalfae VaMs.102]|uniref:Uncharacterized protein n=1 Tax=Verticillium alfalfae (strain VaMs.102 / ATCC MYA-4576 / FGSC 10136) TaxID=526221 RepID=C9S7Q7_VERA1|nr:hypothetical protein VDBG_00901 [Verticillium alfalfae VaMs.102]EEY14792.1 hypothetical protein VDBG_00901 [Verticillium alfalfae VaMs.102]